MCVKEEEGIREFGLASGIGEVDKRKEKEMHGSDKLMSASVGAKVFFFKQKTTYEISACLVDSEMCIRDRSKVLSPKSQVLSPKS